MAKTNVRPLELDDLAAAGRILYRAFSTSFRRHGFTEPLPDARAGAALASAVRQADPAGSLILETAAGRPIGVAFFQRCRDHAFIGPVAVDPDIQGMGHGRRLLQEVLTLTGDTSARLLQDAFNPVSFRFYAHSGFVVRDTLALLITGPGGPAPGPFERMSADPTGGVWSLRDIDARDLQTIAELDRAAYGVDRSEILSRVCTRMRGVILEGPERERGFGCAFPGAGVWIIGPAWAEDGRTLAAIVVGLSQRCARNRDAVALFAPASARDVVSPLLDVGFRVSHLVNLMVRGLYVPPRDVILPVLPVDTAGHL